MGTCLLTLLSRKYSIKKGTYNLEESSRKSDWELDIIKMRGKKTDTKRVGNRTYKWAQKNRKQKKVGNPTHA